MEFIIPLGILLLMVVVGIFLVTFTATMLVEHFWRTSLVFAVAFSVGARSEYLRSLEFNYGLFFLLFMSMVWIIIVGVSESVSKFTDDVRGRNANYLHNHHDLGWHDHPYERNHAHFNNDMSGPFYYVDERVIDQRDKDR